MSSNPPVLPQKIVDSFVPMLRRVRVGEIKRDAWTRPDGLEYCLSCWKSIMNGDPDRDLGTKTMRGLRGDGDGYGADMHESQQSSDREIGAATGAMIDGLSMLHRWAIYRVCSITTAWRFPNADFVTVASEAKEELAHKLKKNSCTGSLF